MNLVVVESPAKAKTIKKYLGPDFEVVASYGHVRDLVPKEGAVDTADGFAMKYQVIERNEKHVQTIASKLKGAEALYLATDPDREGEAISWHLMELLKKRRQLGRSAGVPGGLQRDHQARRPGGGGQSPGNFHGPGQCPAGPAGPGLSGGLQPLAPAVEEGAARTLGGAGAKPGPAPDRRARAGDRGLQDPRILDHRRGYRPRRARASRPA